MTFCFSQFCIIVFKFQVKKKIVIVVLAVKTAVRLEYFLQIDLLHVNY